MGVASPADDAVRNELARGRGIAVVGPPGSGKTSTLAVATLDPEGVGRSHVPLTLSVMGSEVVSRANDPRYLAQRLVRAIGQISHEASQLAELAASTGTATSAAATWKAQVGAGSTQFGRELRQRTEAVDFERSPTEVLDAARASLELAAENHLHLVALLEDADGLLRLPGQSDEQRHEIANAFFMDGLAPLIRELPLPILLAVQPSYRDLEGFHMVAGLLGATVDAPAPSQLSGDGVRLLLGESLRTAGILRQLHDIFTEDALAAIGEHRYSMSSIRHLLQICDRAVGHAQNLNKTSVEADDVGYALTQD